MRFRLADENYKGLCRCGKEAKHKHWTEFETPIPERRIEALNLTLPTMTGVWDWVCDEHR